MRRGMCWRRLAGRRPGPGGSERRRLYKSIPAARPRATTKVRALVEGRRMLRTLTPTRTPATTPSTRWREVAKAVLGSPRRATSGMIAA